MFPKFLKIPKLPTFPKMPWAAPQLRLRLPEGMPVATAGHVGLYVIMLALLVVALLSGYVLYAVAFAYDVILVDVTLHDGSGRAATRASVALRSDRIAAIWIGRPGGVMPRVRIAWNVHELDLAPGFIDTHSHADLSIAPGSRGPIAIGNLVAQGVTTAIMGNCGRSVLPVEPLARRVDTAGASINLATLVGFNDLRKRVVRDSLEPATASQIAAMRAEVRRAMDAGALGVSTGIAYGAGRIVTEEEMTTILDEVASVRGVHASHIRDEGHDVLDAVDEVLWLGSASRISTVISHLKITGPANCSLTPMLVRRLHDADKVQGVTVYADQYPYAASSTNLDIYLPDWFVAADSSQRQAWLAENTFRTRLQRDVKARLQRDGFESLEFCRIVEAGRRPSWQGQSIAQIDRARRGDASTLDTQIALMLELLDAGGAQMIYENICPDAMQTLSVEFPTMIGTDSAIRLRGEGKPHPRAWGTFPRVFAELVRRKRLLDIDEAVHRMTGLPASVFGLADRGLIAPGAIADLVLFDKDAIADRATYQDPFEPPAGIKAVWVNGRVAAGDWRPAFERVAPDLAATYGGRFVRMERVGGGTGARADDSHERRPVLRSSRRNPAV